MIADWIAVLPLRGCAPPGSPVMYRAPVMLRPYSRYPPENDISECFWWLPGASAEHRPDVLSDRLRCLLPDHSAGVQRGATGCGRCGCSGYQTCR